jgi:molybdopterin molybdotransferase
MSLAHSCCSKDKHLTTFEEALEIIRSHTAVLPTEKIPTQDIAGRVCAENLSSPTTIQSFDNSAMDGFALHAEDLENATLQNPVTLKCIGKIAAGDKPETQETPFGCCREIMTGAPMPGGCNAVVPVELITEKEGVISFTAPVKVGQHIRKAGEDFKVGDAVIEAGTIMGSQHVLTLATLGISYVEVYQKPKIAVLSTGKEIIEDLTEEAPLGKIYNSTGPYLVSSLTTPHTDVKFYGTVPDKPEAFPAKIKAMQQEGVKIIISTGAVSMGRYDFVRSSLEALGAEILFHKVAIRPGKPNLFAKLPDGTLFFGLPGNPAASVVACRFFVEAALRKMIGRDIEKPLTAELTNDIFSKEGFQFFLKTKVSVSDNGKIQASILQGQQSFMVSGFLTANAWAVVPQDATSIPKFSHIKVYPLSPLGWQLTQEEK